MYQVKGLWRCVCVCEGVAICLLNNLFAVTLTSALWIYSSVADIQHDVTFTLTMWLISH